MDHTMVEYVLGMAAEIATAMVREMAVSMFQARVASVYADGAVNLRRLHNANDD